MLKFKVGMYFKFNETNNVYKVVKIHNCYCMDIQLIHSPWNTKHLKQIFTKYEYTNKIFNTIKIIPKLKIRLLYV